MRSQSTDDDDEVDDMEPYSAVFSSYMDGALARRLRALDYNLVDAHDHARVAAAMDQVRVNMGRALRLHFDDRESFCAPAPIPGTDLLIRSVTVDPTATEPRVELYESVRSSTLRAEFVLVDGDQLLSDRGDDLWEWLFASTNVPGGCDPTADDPRDGSKPYATAVDRAGSVAWLGQPYCSPWM